jgi:hypothetical protein
MKNFYLKSVFFLSGIFISIPLLAFPGDPDGGDDPPFEDPTPIDNYMWVLVFIAVCLGCTLLAKSMQKSKI